jgi:hypothetical protein
MADFSPALCEHDLYVRADQATEAHRLLLAYAGHDEPDAAHRKPDPAGTSGSAD